MYYIKGRLRDKRIVLGVKGLKNLEDLVPYILFKAYKAKVVNIQKAEKIEKLTNLAEAPTRSEWPLYRLWVHEMLRPGPQRIV